MQLRPLTLGDLATIYLWSQDEVFCRANGWSIGLSWQQLRTWWMALLQTSPDVMLRSGVAVQDQLVGFVELSSFDWQEKTAVFGIAIGARSLWGQGIGFQAGQLMLQHGFDHLQLKAIFAEVHAPNLRSLALMRKLGFEETGRLPLHEVYQGTLSDVVCFVLESSCWNSRI
ncbi:GNAT family N-acetyltransferase [Deinococcus cellulosilyticus]|uniref:GNAT family N-acetyltransferase n=1 Tax=Deinococcus cellulosilyticus TaxID=401558 RepID=UPI001649861B|nr:GNAT family protein [Deinococcus cellulosilyticus]